MLTASYIWLVTVFSQIWFLHKYRNYQSCQLVSFKRVCQVALLKPILNSTAYRDTFKKVVCQGAFSSLTFFLWKKRKKEIDHQQEKNIKHCTLQPFTSPSLRLRRTVSEMCTVWVSHTCARFSHKSLALMFDLCSDQMWDVFTTYQLFHSLTQQRDVWKTKGTFISVSEVETRGRKMGVFRFFRLISFMWMDTGMPRF